ncbi:MAG: T9SS type A sorting domain-containing protein [Oceanihabitans sp.]|nr:T9SS type A sorting domain-containing protein [Oceanihabitans sp.]
MKQTYFKNKKNFYQQTKKIGLTAFIFLSLGTIKTNAQESLNTSGGNISSSDGSISQSVGQLFINPINGSNGNIYQGVQFAIDLENLDTNSYLFDLNVKTFPNPATSELNLQVSNINSHKLSYKIYDFLGRLIKSDTISTEKTTINIEDLPNAAYLLNVFSENQNLIKSFKILKN